MSDTLDKMQKTLAAATFAELDFPRQLPPKTTRRELLSLFRSSLQNLKNQIAQAENVFALLSRGIPHTERPEMTMHRQQMKAALNHAASQATMQVAVESDRSLHRSLGSRSSSKTSGSESATVTTKRTSQSEQQLVK